MNIADGICSAPNQPRHEFIQLSGMKQKMQLNIHPMAMTFRVLAIRRTRVDVVMVVYEVA
jgi:hypothetical protein